MIAVLRDLSCPNTLDCLEIRGPLDDGRVLVRGDKPDAAVLAELNLPDHEGAVIVPPSLVLGVRDVLTLDQLGKFVASHHTRDLFRLETLSFYNAASDADYDETGRFVHAEVIGDPASAAPFLAIAELLWNQATNFSTWWDTHPHYHRDTPVA